MYITTKGIASRRKRVRVPDELTGGVAVGGRPTTVRRDEVVACVMEAQVDQPLGVALDDGFVWGTAVVVVRVPAHQRSGCSNYRGGYEGGCAGETQGQENRPHLG